jgi:hypothetical protein
MEMTNDSNANQETLTPQVEAIVRQPLRVWFVMIQKPDGKWHRVGNRYLQRKTATSWLKFVRCAWLGCAGKVSGFTIRFTADGKIHPRCVRVLDEKYNLSVP